MPKTRTTVLKLLDRLDHRSADQLEGQDIDFKRWDTGSLKDEVKRVIAWAVCMANGGGGTVVFGVCDKAVGRAQAIKGVPQEVNVNRIRAAVYDGTDPKLTPVFDEIRVAEGTGRVLAMHVYPGLPPYTDTAGRGTIRIGKDCKPLTGTIRREIAVGAGENDYTMVEVSSDLALLSPAAMEVLRRTAQRERAPEDLLGLSDEDLLKAVGVMRAGHLTRAALLLAGSLDAIRKHMPGFAWTHLRMSSDTNYSDRIDGNRAIPLALDHLLDRISANNPIQTVRQGLFHFEYRKFPEIALREGILNAFCHADYQISGPVLIKQFQQKIEITNPGSLIGGITPQNILHHTPVTRNHCLVSALVKLRLVNRSNLGMHRIYKSLLIEGKEPPNIHDSGRALRLTLHASNLSVPFRSFCAKESDNGNPLNVDQLLVLQHLLHHVEIDTESASRICQRHRLEIRRTLSDMTVRLGYLDQGGSGRNSYWTLRPNVHARLAGPGDPERDRRLDWEAAKTRVLSVIRQRAKRGDDPLANADVRRMTRFNRHEVLRLVSELVAEGQVDIDGHGRGARYVFTGLRDRGD